MGTNDKVKSRHPWIADFVGIRTRQSDTLPLPVAERIARRLIDEGWYQTSRKFRCLARLPEGMTGKEALLEEAKKERPWDAEKWVNCLGERSAGDHWLRCYSRRVEECNQQVSQKVFDAFRRLGGGTYRETGKEG